MLSPLAAYAMSVGGAKGNAGLQLAGNAFMEQQSLLDEMEKEQQQKAAIGQYLRSIGLDEAQAGAIEQLPTSTSNVILNQELGYGNYVDPETGGIVQKRRIMAGNMLPYDIDLKEREAEQKADDDALKRKIEQQKADAYTKQVEKTDKKASKDISANYRKAEQKIISDSKVGEDTAFKLKSAIDAIDKGNLYMGVGGETSVAKIGQSLLNTKDYKAVDTAIKAIQAIGAKIKNEGQGSVSNFERELYAAAEGLGWDNPNTPELLQRAFVTAEKEAKKNASWREYKNQGYDPTDFDSIYYGEGYNAQPSPDTTQQPAQTMQQEEAPQQAAPQQPAQSTDAFKQNKFNGYTIERVR